MDMNDEQLRAQNLAEAEQRLAQLAQQWHLRRIRGGLSSLVAGGLNIFVQISLLSYFNKAGYQDIYGYMLVNIGFVVAAQAIATGILSLTAVARHPAESIYELYLQSTQDQLTQTRTKKLRLVPTLGPSSDGGVAFGLTGVF